MNQPFSTIQAQSADGVLTITLNRPEVFNAFNEPMSVELSAALRNAQRDDAVRCIVLTGAGRAFCSGQDLAEIRDRYAPSLSPASAGSAPRSLGAPNANDRPEAGPSETSRDRPDAGSARRASAAPSSPAVELDFGNHLRQKFNPVVSRLRAIEKPVIAAVNGAAAGAGASFAFACDLRLCARSSYFLMAFVHVGLIPDSGATITLLQHVGYARAAELCFLGEKLPAEEALRYNLVNRVFDDDKLMDAAREIAARLASMPTRAIGLTKRALGRAWLADLDEQLEYEAFLQQAAGHSADHREGVLAFLEKRKATFVGR